MSPFRVALVGLGEAGFTLHLPALATVRTATVVGACDHDADRRNRAAQRFQVPVFNDFDEMLARARPDVVVVGTPPSSHADYCLRSLAGGAHVICEKPFTASVTEADCVIRAATAAGRRVALNHEFREMPIFRALRAAADEAPPPGVTFVQVWQLMNLAPWAESGWRGEMLQRTLYEAGVHLVDFLIALFREKPVSASASISTGGMHDGETDAIAVVTLEFSRGRLAQIVQNRLCKGETQYFEVRAETANASLRASFGGRARISAGLHRSTTPHVRIDYGASGVAWREVRNKRTLLARNPKDPTMVATRYVFEQTLKAFHEGTPAPAPAEQARDTLEVIAACYHSARTGRRVSLESGEVQALAGMKMGAEPAA
jgi:predicted dehydrogenase